MSESLSPSWIADYLINIAETYGCNISNLPVHLKPGKKIQLLQFLTFRQFTQDDCIWAYVSDKHLQIPVKFSQRAIVEYEKVNPPDSQEKRLTQQRCAIATIKSFKPMFQRVPTGQVGRMSVLETLALNVDYVQVVGAAGEPEFGSPRTLDTHSELNEWMEGLRAGDGSGNVLKLRKEKKLAQERGEISVTETLTAHEQRGYWSGRRVDDIVSNNHAALPERKPYTEQDDWRESIAKKPLRFYKRPTGKGVTASKPTPEPTVEASTPAPPIKRIFKSGKGALDLNSSPVVTRGTDDGSPALPERQTTPSEWPASPELSHNNASSSREAAGVLPISPPSTPPLFTPEQLQAVRGHSARVSDPAANHSPQVSPAVVQQTIPSDLDTTSLRSRSPQNHRRSLPTPSNPVFPSASVATSPMNRATSFPSGVVRLSASHSRRVPPPSVKNTKEACGEILVPGSDPGGPGTQSLPNENNSTVDRRRAKTAASPSHDIGSMRASPSPERVNGVHDGRSPMVEPGASQEPNNGQLDDLSRIAVNGSYADQLNGNGVRTHNGPEHGEGDTSPGHQRSYEPLPPSSPPIHSQAPSWNRSTVLVEETAVVEESITHETSPNPRSQTAKRPRPSSPPPMRNKRPRLVSREPVIPRHQVHGATPSKGFDPELLEVGIEVDLGDYDDSPPRFPWGKEMSRPDFRPPDHPLLITNSKLADIWKSVRECRGWCEKAGGG